MRDFKCPSGALLKISPSPFAEAKALYQALLKEVKGMEISSKTDMVAFYKDMFCAGFSSPEIEKCLWACMAKCLYDGGKGLMKIDQDTFEPISAREDYMTVCMEVTKENVLPFAKHLYAEWVRALEMMPKSPESKSPKTT